MTTDEWLKKYMPASTQPSQSEKAEWINKYLPAPSSKSTAQQKAQGTAAATRLKMGGIRTDNQANTLPKAGTSVPASAKMLPTAKQSKLSQALGLLAPSTADADATFAYDISGIGQNEGTKNALTKAQNTAAAKSVLEKYALKTGDTESAWTPQKSTGNRLLDVLKSGVGDADVDFGTVYAPKSLPTANSRIENMLSAGVTGYGADMAKAASFLLDQRSTEQAENDLDAIFGSGTGAKVTAIPAVKKLNQKISDKLSKYTAGKAEESADYTAMAKDNLGTFGSTLIDAGVAGTQMAMDFATTGGNKLASGLLPMGVRSFGGAVSDAENRGVTDRKAIADYAVGSAAIEVLTEKIGNIVGSPFAKVYGSGAVDDIVEAALQKCCSTDGGRTALRAILSALEEGNEEVIADLFYPILKSATIDKGAKYGDNFSWADTLHDGLVGAVMGLAGGGMNFISGDNKAANARLRTYDEAVKDAQSNFTYEGDKIKGLSEKGLLRASQNFSDNMEAQKARQGSFELLTGKQGAELPGRMDTQSGVLNNGRLMTAAEYARNQRSTDDNRAEQQPISNESRSVINKVKESVPALSDMKPLTSITGKELKTGEAKATDRAYNFMSRLGFKVNRPGFGDVLFSKSGIKNSFVGHGYGPEKEAAFAAVPEIIRSGRQIDHSDNWKNRGYSTNLYAGPAYIGGEKTYIGALVAFDKTSNRYYLHEVVDENGNVIYKETPQKSSDGRPDINAGINPVTSDEVSDNSILKTGEKSNTNMLPGNLQTLGNLPRGAAESVIENAESVSKPAESVTENAESGAKKISTREEILKKHKEALYEKVAELFPTVKNRTLSEAVDTLAAQIQQPTADINTIYQAFEKLWNESTMTVPGDIAYREAAQTLKGSKIYINDSIRADIGDNWRSVAAKAKRAGITFTRDINDRGVDVLNQSMAESYPGLFNAASTDGADMVYNLLDIMDKSKDVTTDLPTGMENQYGKDVSGKAMTEQYKRLIKVISDTDRSLKTDLQSRREAIQAKRESNTPEKQLERARQEMSKETPKTTAAIDKVTGKYPITTDVSYAGAESMVAREKAAYKTKKLVEKMEKDLNPTAQEKAFAKDMASGLYTERDIPLTLNSKKIIQLADYYAANSSFKDNLLARRARDNKAAREEVAEKLVKNSTGHKPPRALSLNFNTMKRNIERSFGSEAPEIIKWVIDPIRENSKNKKLWQMEQRAGLDAFGLSSSESALVQQVIEGRAAGEEIAKLEPHEQKDIKAVIQNMNNGMTRAKANAEFNLNQTQLDLAERYRKWQNTKASLKNADADKVTKAADWLTEQYGHIYDAINDFLTAHGYKPIGFIKGYAPHLQPEETMSGFAKALQRLGLETEVVELPTEIAGRTETFRPGKSWDPNFLSRNLGTYEDNAVAGWERYIDYISNVFYHTDDIQKLRTLSETLRSKYAPDEIREQISWARGMRDASPVEKTQELKRLGRISQGTQLTAEQADFEWQKYTDSLFENIKNLTKYGDFVSVLDDYTNKLALKQTKLDRSVESLVGRKALNWGNQLTKIFGESTIVGNLSSALNQTAQLPMLRAEVGGKYIREALKDIADGTLTAEEFDKQSAFLVGKMDLKSAEDSRAWKDKTFQQKKATVMDVGAIPFEAVDDLASRLIVRAKYLEAIGNGKSTAEAIKIADEYADRLVGSREQGMKAMIFENKNAATKLFSTFQLEVANSWEHLSHDLRAEYRAVEASQGKNSAVNLMAGRLAKYLISAFLLNRLTDEIYGGTPAPFDIGGYILGSVAAGYGKSTNNYLATVLDSTLEKMGGDRIFGTQKNQKFDASAFAKEMGYSVGGDIPYLSNVGAMLGITDTTLPIPQVWNSKLSSGAKALLKAEDAESQKSAMETLKAGTEKAVSTWAPMGNQARKTITGARMLLKGGEYSGEKLEFPIPSGAKGLLTGAQGLLFGSNATQAAQNYYAAGSKKLTDKATAAYQAAVKGGADKQTVYDAIQTVRSAKKTDTLTETQAKIKALQGADLSREAKRAIYEGVISDKHSKDIQSIITAPGDKKLTFDNYLAIQYEYTAINQKDLKATEKATEFSSWINQQKYSGAQEKAVREAFKYYNSSVAESTAYDKLTSAGLSDSAAKKAADAVLNLPSTATTYDRYRAAAAAMPTDAAKLKALSAMMTESDGDDTAYQKLKTGYDYGVSPEVYLTVKEQIAGLEHLNQDSAQVLLDGTLGLDADQKAALWQLANKSWKGYKNPYNTAIGNTIYQAYN